MIINLVACTMLQASGKPRVMAPPVRVEQNQRFLLQQNRFEDKQLRNETLGISRNTSLVGSQYRNALHNMINMSRWETHQSVRHALNHACDQEISSPPPSLQAKCVLVFIERRHIHLSERRHTYIKSQTGCSRRSRFQTQITPIYSLRSF